jgi:transposase
VTRSLLVLADRLGELGVTRVVMEATSDYWKSPFYLLEAQGFEVWLVNAREVKHLPGRPKTDRPGRGLARQGRRAAAAAPQLRAAT